MGGFHPWISSAWRTSISPPRTEPSSRWLLPESASHEENSGTCFSLFVAFLVCSVGADSYGGAAKPVAASRFPNCVPHRRRSRSAREAGPGESHRLSDCGRRHARADLQAGCGRDVSDGHLPIEPGG